MSFNPYSTRPVGSKQFEEHIQDIYVSKYYDQIPESDKDIIKQALHGQIMWRNDPNYTLEAPWENLIIAVTVQAVIDYVDMYAKWKKAISEEKLGFEVLYHSRMLQLENEFFRQYEMTERAFDKLLTMLSNDEYSPAKHSAGYIARKIYKNYFAYKEKERKK